MPGTNDQRQRHARSLRRMLAQAKGLELCMGGQWAELERELGDEIYVQALFQLSRLELPPQSARACLLAILDHQRSMALGLGRDVALLTAACDYFTGVDPLVRDPVLLDARLLAQKEESALKDELTGLFNRRYFNQELPREIERFRRFGHPFSLLLLDLDNFKAFNDLHGHSAGDEVLRGMAELMGGNARVYDRVVRYGGEEFALILPQALQQDALAVAERIRAAAAGRTIPYGGERLGPVTISIGAATFPQDALDMGTLVHRADEALYEAKSLRNSVRPFRDAKRQHPRFPLSDPISVRIVTDESTQLDARSLDISFGGMLCEARLEVPAETTLSLVLSDPELGLNLPIRATVRRVSCADGRSYRLGLSFTLDSRDDHRTLLALIEHRVHPAAQLSALRRHASTN